MHVYLATGLRDEQAEAEDNERIEIVRWPLADLDGAIAATRDAKTLIGLLWLKTRGYWVGTAHDTSVQRIARRWPVALPSWRPPASAASPRPSRLRAGRTAPAQVFAPNPVADLGHPDAHRPEGRRLLLGRSGPRPGLPPRHAHRPRRQRHAHRRLRQGHQRDREGGAPTPAAASSTRATRTSSSRPWATTGSPRPSATSSRWASARRCRPSTSASSSCASTSSAATTRSTGRGRASSRSRFGKGGVDDAEDAEVIVHEYGHSVQDNQVPGFGSTPDAGAIGEAFGDYLAVTVSEHFAPTPDEPCVADWDSTSYTSTVPHCLRRVDGNKHYPEDLVGEVHADGEIWSRALWDIHKALGARLADTIIIARSSASRPTSRCRRPRRRRSTPPACTERARSGRCRRRSPRAGSHSRARAVAAARTAGSGGEDRRDHGRQRYRPARVRTDRCTRRRRDERADARLPRLPRVRARAVAQHARGLSLRPAAARGLPGPPRRGRRRRPARRPQRVPVRAGDRGRGPPAGRGRHAAAQGRVPALLLPPPAPRGRARPRPDRRPARAAQEPAAAAGPQPRRGRPPARALPRAPTPRRCATAPCSSSCTPAACAPRRPSASTCATSTSRSASLRARGKGSKERMVPIGREAVAATKVYVERGRPVVRRPRRRAAPVRQPPGRRPHAPGPLQDRPAPRARGRASRTA